MEGKWTLLILRDLARGVNRFSLLERSLSSISPKTLSTKLKTLHDLAMVMGPLALWPLGRRAAQRSGNPIIIEIRARAAMWGRDGQSLCGAIGSRCSVRRVTAAG